MKNCKICGNGYNSDSGLVRHVFETHGMKSKEYYEKFIASPPPCLWCQKPTQFLSIGKGHNTHCSYECGGMSRRAKLRYEYVKDARYRMKRSEYLRKLWKHYEESGIKEYIMNKHKLISDTTIKDSETRFTPFGFIDTGIHYDDSLIDF